MRMKAKSFLQYQYDPLVSALPSLPAVGVLIGLGVSGLIAAGLHLVLRGSGGMLLWRSLPAYLLWLGLPSLIFILFSAWVGWAAVKKDRERG